MRNIRQYTCTKCGRLKPETEFFARSNRVSGRMSICKLCSQINTREWGRKNRERQSYHNRRMLLKREYGLTIEAYTAMLQLQFYKCAACGDKFDPEIIKGKVCVDHDHKTGKLRELLCHRCNVTLGNVNDEVERLEKLIAYLKKHAGGDD